MSRGHGRVQRWVLDFLTRAAVAEGHAEWITVVSLAGQLAAVSVESPGSGAFNTYAKACSTPTRAQIEAMRRAVKRLAAQGLIECDEHRRWEQERPLKGLTWDERWRVKRRESRWFLCARAVPGLEQQWREAETEADRLAADLKRRWTGDPQTRHPEFQALFEMEQQRATAAVENAERLRTLTGHGPKPAWICVGCQSEAEPHPLVAVLCVGCGDKLLHDYPTCVGCGRSFDGDVERGATPITHCVGCASTGGPK